MKSINQYVAETVTVATLISAMFVGIYLARGFTGGPSLGEVLAIILASVSIVVAVDIFGRCWDGDDNG